MTKKEEHIDLIGESAAAFRSALDEIFKPHLSDAALRAALIVGVEQKISDLRSGATRSAVELTLPQVRDIVPQFSNEELAAFHACAEAHQWQPRSGVSPSEFVKTHFSQWLGCGLTRVLVAQSQQKKWDAAYAAEILRHPENRIKGLIERPRNLPAGTPAPTSTKPTKRSGTHRLVSELTPEELEVRRAKVRKRTQRYRLRKSQP